MINRYHITNTLSHVLKTLVKNAGLCSNFLCPFTSRSRLFALTTDLPGPADGPLNIVQGNILASWSQNQNPFRMSEGDKSDGNLGVLPIWALDDTRYSSKIAISWCSCLATSRWWWIHNRSSISYLTNTLCQLLKTLLKNAGLFSKFPCLFTSQSRLFALTTDLPGTADGPLNIVQGNILASWSQNQNPVRMSEGDRSDGNLGVLPFWALDDTRYSSKIAISWCSCLATSRWWWIHNRSSISYLTNTLCQLLKTLLKNASLFSKCPCLFTSRSRLFALTTDLPGTADGTRNIVQGNILASWSQNQNPFRMSEGDESDGNLGVLHNRTLDETRYSSKIAIFWCSCLATSRWWWIHNSSSIHHD